MDDHINYLLACDECHVSKSTRYFGTMRLCRLCYNSSCSNLRSSDAPTWLTFMVMLIFAMSTVCLKFLAMEED